MQNLAYRKLIKLFIHKSYPFISNLSRSSGHFYSEIDNIIELTPEKFNDLVLNSKSFWLVQFYSSKCSHCQDFMPEYEKVGNRLKGIIKVGAVNAYEYGSIANRYNIEDVPTLKFFADDKLSPKKYYGTLTADDIVKAVMDMIK